MHKHNTGRRLSKNLCIDHPNPEEIVRALNMLMIRSIFEGDKCYPKDWMTRGRWKVELKDNNNVAIYSHINTSTMRLMQRKSCSVRLVKSSFSFVRSDYRSVAKLQLSNLNHELLVYVCKLPLRSCC